MAVEYKKQHFNSLGEFYKFVSETKENLVFMGKPLSSKTRDKKFTGTKSFEEAVELMKNGWDEGAKNLEGKLQAKLKTLKPKTTQRSKYDVVGGNCSVPRYLQGVPTNMVNKKPVVQKTKVVTINKSIAYNAFVTTEQIIEESIKALIIVYEIEAAGTRVNLNIIVESREGNEIAAFTVRIKSANERLNVSKLAFPLVHPSMLRRWLEVSPLVTNPSFNYGYGSAVDEKESRQYLPKGEILLPAFIPDVDKVIKQFA